MRAGSGFLRAHCALRSGISSIRPSGRYNRPSFIRPMLSEERSMPAKKPAPKAAKGKTAASRPAAVKKTAVARKLPAERVNAAAVHVRKPAPAPLKAAAHPLSMTTEETIEMRKAGPSAPEVAPKESPGAP